MLSKISVPCALSKIFVVIKKYLSLNILYMEYFVHMFIILFMNCPCHYLGKYKSWIINFHNQFFIKTHFLRVVQWVQVYSELEGSLIKLKDALGCAFRPNLVKSLLVVTCWPTYQYYSGRDLAKVSGLKLAFKAANYVKLFFE